MRGHAPLSFSLSSLQILERKHSQTLDSTAGSEPVDDPLRSEQQEACLLSLVNKRIARFDPESRSSSNMLVLQKQHPSKRMKRNEKKAKGGREEGRGKRRKMLSMSCLVVRIAHGPSTLKIRHDDRLSSLLSS